MSSKLNFSFFYLSLTPLWISIVIIDAISIAGGGEHVLIEYITIIVIFLVYIICSVYLFRYFFKSKKNKENVFQYKIKEAVREKTVTSEYLLAYILPLFAFDFLVWEGVLLFLIFFSTLSFLTIKHNVLNVNIMLEILGFGFYECTLKKEQDEIKKKIITKRDLTLETNKLIKTKFINNEYCLDVNYSKNKK